MQVARALERPDIIEEHATASLSTQRSESMAERHRRLAVLPLSRVDDWTPENLADKVEAVRRSFSDTLQDWPIDNECVNA